MENKNNEGTALFLSGGGLRATLFHLGVVRAMRESHIDGHRIIDDVTNIYSVSGGSILAAHMLANWERYTGSDHDFLEAVNEITSFSKRNVRDRIIRRWLLTGWLSPIVSRAKKAIFSTRTYHLQKQFTSLLGNLTLKQAYNKDALPKFHFMATGFRSGQLCSFSGTKFEVYSLNQEEHGQSFSACNTKLAFAVTASSAFPPLFPPVELKGASIINSKGEIPKKNFLLSDGGVLDNTGLKKFWKDKLSQQLEARLIVSDASSPFKSNSKSSFSGFFSRNIRAMDILMHRAGFDTTSELSKYPVTLIKPDLISQGILTKNAQELVKYIRTDIDKFDDKIAAVLLEHGWSTGCEAFGLKTHGPWFSSLSNNQEKLPSLIDKNSNRTHWRTLFDTQDFSWLFAMWASIILLLASVCYLSVSAYKGYTAKEAKIKALEEKAVDLELVKLKTNELHALIDPKNSEAILLINDILKVTQSQINKSISEKETTTNDSLIDYISGESAENKQVFIQYHGISTYEIEGLNSHLRERGWKMQGVSGEKLEVAAGLHQIRYSGSNKALADELAQSINDEGKFSTVTTKKLDIIGEDVLEVWISEKPES